jgi:ubiquitin-protein ligase
MDIEANNSNSFNFNLSTNNSQNNSNNNTIPIDIENDKDSNLFAKNKKSIYAQNQSSNKKNKKSPRVVNLCEGRLLNDLAEYNTSKIAGKIYKININEYKKNEDNSFELIVDYVSFFSVKFIFQKDYPCIPPSIVYYSGLKPKNIFDDDGNVLIESIKLSNWSPSIWLSTLIYSIELLISSEINNGNNSLYNNFNDKNQNLTNYFLMCKRTKYKKRNWDEYLNECNNYYNKETEIIPELEKNLKQLKIK